MHSSYSRADSLTSETIAAAIEVHRHLGPGLLESIYEWCFFHELTLRGLKADNQRAVKIVYKDISRDEILRFDLLVEGSVLVEIKAVEQTLPIHKAQLLSYMRLLDVPLGLLINFNNLKLVDGVSRLILPNADE